MFWHRRLVTTRLGRQLAAVALVVTAASVALSTLLVAPAGAHASLLGTSPGPGQHLDRPPAEIVLSFSERINPLRDGVRLVDSQGRQVGPGEQAHSPPGEPTRVRLPVPPGLPDGTYAVSWRVVSADSHPINGAFVFTVGAGSAEPVAGTGAAGPPGEAGTDADGLVVSAFWLARVAGYAALALLLGGSFFLVMCWPAGWAHRRARRIVWVGWAGGLAAAVASLLLQGSYAAGTSLRGIADSALLRETMRTDYGTFVAARIGLLVLLGLWLSLGLADLLRHRVAGRTPAFSLVGAGVLALALTATWVGTGHANAGPTVQAMADTAHLVAMSAWVGGLVMLAACVLPRSRSVPLAEVATAVPRFSKVAMVSVAVLVGTGLVQAWLELGGLAALAGSGYGRLLFAKLAGVGILLWLGAMSRTVVQRRWARAAAAAAARPRRAERERDQAALTQLLRSVRLEAAIVVVVLGVTALLVATPPGTHGHATAAALPAAAAEYTGPVVRELPLPGGGQALVRVEPARVGPNRISVTVRDPGGAAKDVPEVTAKLHLASAGLGPFDLKFNRIGPGEFNATDVTVPAVGSWRVELAVRTSDFDLSEAAADVPVS